jgi:hypothetical protein
MAVIWTKDQPAVVLVRQLVGEYFPAVGLHYDALRTAVDKHIVRNHPSKGVGGFVVRTTASGGFSLHSEGRAADIYVTVKNAHLKKFGDELFNRLVSNAKALELEEVIWNRSIWSAKKPYVRRYTGKNPHTAHLHVGFTRSGSQKKPSLLETVVKEAADAANAK